MNQVCQGPYHRNWKKRQAEYDIMQESKHDDVRNPHSLAAEVRRIRVRIAVCNADIHGIKVAINQQN